MAVGQVAKWLEGFGCAIDSKMQTTFGGAIDPAEMESGTTIDPAEMETGTTMAKTKKTKKTN